MLRLVPHATSQKKQPKVLSSPLRWVPLLSLCRTSQACKRRSVCACECVWSRVCVRRASRSTAGTEPGEGAVSAGYLLLQPLHVLLQSGGAASKPGPDSGEERMASITHMINGGVRVHWTWQPWKSVTPALSTKDLWGFGIQVISQFISFAVSILC